MPADSTLRDRACITRRIEHHNPSCVVENAMRSEREAAPPPPPPSAVIRLQRTSATSDDTPAYVDLLHEPSAEQLTSHTADGNYLTLCELKSMLEKADAMSACAYSLAVHKEAAALRMEASNKLGILKRWNGSKNAWIRPPLT